MKNLLIPLLAGASSLAFAQEVTCNHDSLFILGSMNNFQQTKDYPMQCEFNTLVNQPTWVYRNLELKTNVRNERIKISSNGNWDTALGYLKKNATHFHQLDRQGDDIHLPEGRYDLYVNDTDATPYFWVERTKNHNKNTLLTDVYPNKPAFRPGEMVTLTLDAKTALPENSSLKITLSQWHTIGTYIFDIKKTRRSLLTYEVDLPDLFIPNLDYQGYGISVEYFDPDGHLSEKLSTAIDISSDWTKFPRYGYLSEFFKTPLPFIRRQINWLSRFHINGLQYYDAIYRHDEPMPIADKNEVPSSWQDLADRYTDAKTIKNYITESNELKA